MLIMDRSFCDLNKELTSSSRQHTFAAALVWGGHFTGERGKSDSESFGKVSAILGLSSASNTSDLLFETALVCQLRWNAV